MKINQLTLKGFRGVKSEIDINLPDNSSLLLYGDNGCGKSSVLDAIEWFVSDQVSHLSGEEIEMHGGIRHASNPTSDECSVKLSFSKPNLENKKTLNLIKEKNKTEFEVGLSGEQEQFLRLLSQDHIWIRSSDLMKFVLGTKSDRLNDVSSIIGFEPVTNTKTVLKKASNEIKGIIKAKNFATAKANEQKSIAENLDALVSNEQQFLAVANAIIKPYTSSQPTTLIQLQTAIHDLSSSLKSSDIKKHTDLANAIAAVNRLEGHLQAIEDNYSDYIEARLSFHSDKERLGKLNEKILLENALKLLSHHQKDNCPLCLQIYSRAELEERINDRLQELKSIQEEFDNLIAKSSNINLIFSQVMPSLNSILNCSSYFTSDEIVRVLSAVNLLNKAVTEFVQGLQSSVDQQFCVLPLKFTENLFEYSSIFKDAAQKSQEEINKSASSQLSAIISKLSVSLNAFNRIEILTAEEIILTNQANTLSLIVTQFNEFQRTEMSKFLEAISSKINEYYLSMNPSDKVDNIRLACIEDKNGEFAGLAIHFLFHGKLADSPRKFLSESNLNALGLCLFLSSVRAYNKTSKFIVLDDVISSFDKNHRVLFARLLLEKFNDHQLLILTHESEWYEYLSSLVKGKPWRVLRTTWSKEEGAVISMAAGEILDQIKRKIADNDESNLGNLIRRYGERCLKDIAHLLGVPVAFQFNDRNESRTFGELYSPIRGYLKKKATAISDLPQVSALSTCQFFSNVSSHDNPYNPNISDLKVAFNDLQSFLEIFTCNVCSRMVSVEFLNEPEKKITCKCGKQSLSWKD